ncbi:MAG: glycosyltransferase family 61 protein [Prochlorococcaceae cyanobacterium]
MSRAALLHGLQAYNAEHDLAENIWGEAAAMASRQTADHLGINIESAATEGRTVLSRSTPLDLGYSVHCNAPERLHFPLKSEGPPVVPSPVVEVAQLEEAEVGQWMGLHLVCQSGQVVPDASTAYWPLLGAPFSQPRPERVVAELEELFVVVDDNDPENFCHYLCDQLPKVSLAADCRARIPLLVSKPVQPFQLELLVRLKELHGVDLHWLEDGETIRARRLFYVRRAPHQHPFFRGSSWAMDFVRNLVGLPADLEAPEGSLLYIRRLSRRRVVDEEALILELQKACPRLRVVESMGRYSVRDQALLVASHRHLMGPHGAAFTHLALRNQAPLRATELMAEGNGTLSFAIISQRLGIQHQVLLGEAVTTANGPNYPDLRLDPKMAVAFALA